MPELRLFLVILTGAGLLLALGQVIPQVLRAFGRQIVQTHGLMRRAGFGLTLWQCLVLRFIHGLVMVSRTCNVNALFAFMLL